MKTKLTSVEIRGFKSVAYEHPVTLPLSDVTILLGANGAGKSNVISFFRMLHYMMSGTLQKFIAQTGTSLSVLHYGPKVTSTIAGQLSFANAEEQDVYSFTLSAADAQRLIITEENIRQERNGEIVPHEKPLQSNYLESALVDSRDSSAEMIRRLLVQCKAYQFHDSSSNGALRQASMSGAAQYLQSAGNNLASFLLFLRENYMDSYRRIVSSVQMIMPSFGDFYLESDNGFVSLNWRDNSANDYVFTSAQFSDGTIRFIALATLLLQPEKTMPSVIIIDEPELGLHPFAISQLAELIRDASLHTQVIISTQSPQLIDEFPARCVTVIENVEPSGYTTAKQLDEDSLRTWLQDYSLSELWTKNVIGGQPL